MKMCVIPGTRHEIIKMSPVVRACERQEGSDWFVLHTGQHYSYGVDGVFFEEMELPEARYNLDIGSGSGRHGEQSQRMMAGIEEIKICGEA
ncbi:MAG: UDP-N-acetylglucosamine 2-epimerase [archaeon]|nr:UDP-N-acetylglucosamine 2-epimerase [archaeon]